VDREEAVVGLVVEELHAGLGELGANEHRQHSGREEEEDRRREVLHADHLVIGVDPEVVLPAVGAVARVILGLRRLADRVAHPVVEGADPGQEADRRGDQAGYEKDDLAEPDGMPAAPPTAQHDDPAADSEEERRHPRRAEEAGVEEASPAARRRRWTVVDGRRLVVLGDRGHFCLAHLSKASGSITTARERISA
jgi:hypothetical protein